MDSNLKNGSSSIMHKNNQETFKYNDPLMNSISTPVSSNYIHNNNFYPALTEPRPSPLLTHSYSNFSDSHQLNFIPPLYPPNLTSHNYTLRFMSNQQDSNMPSNSINKDSKNNSKLKKKRPTKYNPRRDGLTPNSAGNYRGKKLAEELLTEDQKKAHHIASEQKRRQNIRDGYDMLIASIPQLKHGPRNEAVVLEKALEYIVQLQSKQRDLKTRVTQLQQNLGDTTDYFKDFVDLEIPQRANTSQNTSSLSDSLFPSGEPNPISYHSENTSTPDPNLA